MGAIMCLRKMPSKCSECIFADKEVEYCRLRNSSINAGKIRNVRMPLCLLENEGEYLTRKKEQLKRIVKNDKQREIKKALLEARKQIIDEADFAYADFEQYKMDVLGIEVDDLPNDEFRYGMERALQIISQKIKEVLK